MKMKKIISSFNFCQDLINVFTLYTKCLEEYFKKDENKENHKELYDYYKQLDTNIKNAVNKHGVLKNE